MRNLWRRISDRSTAQHVVARESTVISIDVAMIEIGWIFSRVMSHDMRAVKHNDMSFTENSFRNGAMGLRVERLTDQNQKGQSIFPDSQSVTPPSPRLFFLPSSLFPFGQL